MEHFNQQPKDLRLTWENISYNKLKLAKLYYYKLHDTFIVSYSIPLLLYITLKNGIVITRGWQDWYDHIAPAHPGGGMIIWSYHPAVTMETRTAGIYIR